MVNKTTEDSEKVLSIHLKYVYDNVEILIRTLNATREIYKNLPRGRIGLTLENSSIPTIYASIEMQEIIAKRLEAEIEILEGKIDSYMEEAMITRSKLRKARDLIELNNYNNK